MSPSRSLAVFSCLMALSLVVASCAQPARPPASPKPAAPVPEAKAPAVPPAAPAPSPKPAAATESGPRSGGILPVSAYAEPPHLDLHQSQIVATRQAAIPAYDTLLEYNPLKPDEIIPDLAERYEVSKDGLEYTFYLNKGVKFHDGSLLTAEDVKFNLDRLRNPPRGVLSPRAALLASIDRIETPDASTVKIVTKYPDASFLGGLALSHHTIYPRKAVEEKGDMKRTVLGTGPFKFVSYSPGVSVVFEKNKDYFRKGRPYLDGLVFYIIKDPGTWFAAFRTGRILLTSTGSGGISPAQGEIVEREMKGKARPLRSVGLSNALVQINVSRRPLDDVRVRRALNLLADRPAIIKLAWGGDGIVAVFFVPEPHGKWEFPNAELQKMPGYRTDKAVDIEEAKKLLAEAGHASGLSVSIVGRTLLTNSRAAEVLKEQYKAGGIDLKLDMVDTPVWSDRKAKENYDLLFDNWGVDADDPSAWLENIIPSSGVSFKDAQLDQWKKEQARILDFEQRKALVRRIETRLMETLPAVPSLRGGQFTMGMWETVKNFPVPIGSWNSHKYTEVWLAR
ncbi:MAG: ABC transporter substrate-binding protein [Chloroflexi bacterium]|nr:ABC transporter substrate-binding protein [Chloroflexota bacterium]